MIEKVFLYNPSNLLRKFTFILFDIISFTLSIWLAFDIRGEFNNIGKFDLMPILFMFIILKLIVFSSFKLYDISWKYVSLQDLAQIGKACLISNGLLFIIIYGTDIPFIAGFPKSVLLIDLFLSFLFTSAFKISKRMYLEVMRTSIKKSELKRTLIIGAGSSGEQLLRDINRSQTRKFYPIGFIDDNVAKGNLYLQGLKVLGTTDELPDIIRKYNVDTILVSILTADRKFHRKILTLAKEAGISDVKVVSTINDISNSVQVRVQDIRDIDACDLIGRQAVQINTKDIGSYINNKRVLITGAAGSIGSEIARQVIFYQPSKIAILDINESDLADLELQLGRQFPKSNIKMYLCDISNEHKISKVIENFRPDVIFHAAAYKHVPVMEKYPEEAVRVNILGTNYLTAAAIRFGVKNFVLISTDKAVNPTSIMGASKRIAEYIVTNASKNSSSKFVAVRFGNVIGSRGSALPIFIDQLKHGGPITITHPEMKRYFMTIPESVALVLQAAATGNSGDVFVLDMGEPIKIVDLVRDLIILNNLVPDKDIKIEFTGIREGEKLFEEVLTAEEGVISTSHNKIFKAKMIDRHSMDSIKFMIDELKTLNGHTTKDEWLSVFKRYVPTFEGKTKPEIRSSIEVNTFTN
ncbi:MAG TPA: nucleoside-diphosphate sugar epimerase/dehydratase [Ignavibacteriaceae bacterium]|nr:nucleoside-diphosphate sugar epimerase/dehydratase [Ignavibacteriaceae bacterium]